MTLGELLRRVRDQTGDTFEEALARQVVLYRDGNESWINVTVRLPGLGSPATYDGAVYLSEGMD
jgi:hypothetical protein